MCDNSAFRSAIGRFAAFRAPAVRARGVLAGATLLGTAFVAGCSGGGGTQGAIPLAQTSPLTLMQATALSGGAGYEGRFEDLRIVRTNGLARSVVTVNIKRVLEGQDPDPVLQADDIVFLPSSKLKAAIKSGGINTVASLASLLLIAFQNKL